MIPELVDSLRQKVDQRSPGAGEGEWRVTTIDCRVSTWGDEVVEIDSVDSYTTL